MTQTNDFAVLTGDLVASRDLDPRQLDLAFEVLTKAASAASDWAGGKLRLSRSRGDGWQVAVPEQRADLRIALTFRANLTATGTGLETRIGLARGQISPIRNNDLNAASGPAFVAAGEALDGLAPPALFAHANGGALAASTRLADHISQQWTAAQARAIAPMLCPGPPTHAEVAARLGITRQAVTQALAAAGYDTLSSALDLIEGAPE
jgi:hypothetical protein